MTALVRLVSESAASSGKEWWTVQELIALGSAALPKTPQGINKKAQAEGWRSQVMPGYGGPRGYHLSSLPEAVRLHIARLAAKSVPQLALQLDKTPAPAPISKTVGGVTGKAKGRMESRLAVLIAFDQFRATAGISVSAAVLQFVPAYNAGDVVVDQATRAALPEISRSTLHDWIGKRSKEGAARLAMNYKRTAQSEVEKSPALQNALLGIFAFKPHLSTNEVYKGLKDCLPPGTKLPSLRAVQRYMEKWRKDNPVPTLHLQNPDAARSKFRPAFGSYGAQVTRPGQLWELDATPGDALLTDGRACVVACIDVFTRQARVLVSKTSKASTVAALLRRCILEWGMPEGIKTDNGSDFTAKSIRTALAALQIPHDLCAPYSPWMKPHVERFIGTMNHSIFERLPGYSGHSVADAQALRARETFAKRMGRSDAQVFEAKLTRAELQAALDHWLGYEYERSPHDGLQGRSPFDVACQSEGYVRGMVANERDLDLLLMEAPTLGGIRTVLKNGIQVDGGFYVHADLGLRMGTELLVRLDPADLGTVHCYDPKDASYVCAATDATLLGASRYEVAVEAQILQRKLVAVAQDLKSTPAKLGKKIIEARRTGAPLVIPMPDLQPAIAAIAPPAAEPDADELAEREAFAAQAMARAEQPAPRDEDDDDRFIRWYALDARIQAGEQVSESERDWHGVYQTTSEWRARDTLTKQFGTDWMQFRAAR